MQGITMNELYELISHCHDAEFEYSGTTYVLQPEVNDNKTYLVIWDCTPDAAKCIAKHEIEVEGNNSAVRYRCSSFNKMFYWQIL